MSRKGVSLLEILFASGIMVAAMVPLWGLMGSSHKQVTLSADEIRASQIAAEILEQIENSGWQPEVGEISFAPVSEGKISLAAGVTNDLTGKIKAGDLLGFVAGQVGGKGGGRPDMAMGGGTDARALPAAIASVQKWVDERL